MEISDLLTTKEAADYLRMSPAVIHKMKQDGQLPYVQIRRNVFYSKADLQSLIEVHKVAPKPQTTETTE
jgi:excisionase family DNA binding protein